MLCKDINGQGCKKLLRKGDNAVVEVRFGYIDKDGEFQPDHDVGYYHSKCYDEGLMTS